MKKNAAGKKRTGVALGMTVLLLLAVFPLESWAAPEVVADPSSVTTSAIPSAVFQQGIETAVVKAFDGLAAEAAAEVVASITPDVEKISAEVQAAVLAVQTQKEDIEVNGFSMDASMYPPESVINNIPSQGLAQAREQAKEKFDAGLEQDFALSEKMIQEQVKTLMTQASPQIINKLEPALKALIPKVHSIIEAKIEARIEDEILKVLPDLMTSVPPEMENMSPEEIAAVMKSRIKPKIEAEVRPKFEAIIKEQVDALMVEKLKAPIQEQFQPKLVAMDTAVYNNFIDGLPAYLEKVISKDYIKSAVSAKIAALQAKIPSLVEASRAEIDKKIEDYIDETIDNEAKIYIGNAYVEAPVEPKVVNNRLLVPFRAIATALGAEVEWKYKERQVVMKKGDKNIVLTIDSNVVLVNGQPAKIDAPAGIYENYTMVPVRFIAETFDMDVNWQADWKMVNIEAPAAPAV